MASTTIMDVSMGYEECAPSVAASNGKSQRSQGRRGSVDGGSSSGGWARRGDLSNGERRRSSLFHVADVSNLVEATKTEDGAIKGDKSRGRRSKRRGSVAHVKAPSGADKGPSEETRESRRKTIFHVGEDDVIQDPPARINEEKDARKNRRRRSSLFHVHDLSSRSSNRGHLKDDETVCSNKSSQRSLKLSLFGRRSTTSKDKKKKSLRGDQGNDKSSKSNIRGNNKKRSKNKRKSEDEILMEMEKMQHFVQAINKNPESRKILQEHLQKHHPHKGFCSAA